MVLMGRRGSHHRQDQAYTLLLYLDNRIESQGRAESKSVFGLGADTIRVKPATSPPGEDFLPLQAG